MIKIKSLLFLTFSALLLSCSGDKKTNQTTDSIQGNASTKNALVENYDPNIGLGKYKNIDVSNFNSKIAEEGKTVFETNCSSCHNLTDEKLVGPGLKGITKNHTASWIMNFISNPDAMLEVDPELKKQLALYGMRMPYQNLDDSQTRAVYEYLRKNDGAK
ncbi:c-type cytochrome [Halpernia sp. GG3]